MKIAVDSTVMRNSADKFEAISASIQDIAKKIEAEASELPNGWQGEKTQEFCEQLNALAKNFTTHAQAVSTYAIALREAARLFDEAKA